MAKQIVRFGIIGGGLMGRELAGAMARWCYLLDLDFEARLVAVCSAHSSSLEWFQRNFADLQLATTDYQELLDNPNVDAVYCAVPNNLHQRMYVDTIQAGKHLLGEKPFGIDLSANQAILEAIARQPGVLVRCSSQYIYQPGAYRIAQWLRAGRFGQIIEVETGLWHSSDLNPEKPINWKRQASVNGEYGCMGDLGMHILHIPLRAGWRPRNVRALLSKIITERPDHSGRRVPCDTWDNAILACEASAGDHTFPMLVSTKRIAPGHANTWFIRILSTSLSAEFSSKNPKQIAWLPYAPGDEQAWQVMDVPFQSAYPTIAGAIFEFGFHDAVLQMLAAFCDELLHGPDMRQPIHCVTPEETAVSHRLFTAALESQRSGQTIVLE